MKKSKTKNYNPLTLSNSDQKKDDAQDMFPSHFVTSFLIPFGAVLFAAGVFFSSQIQLPTWVIFVGVLYLIVVTVIVSLNPLRRLISLFQEKRRKKQIANNFYPGLQNSAGEFAELIKEQRGTIPSLLQDINGWDELRNQTIQFDAEHIATIRSWFESIKRQFTSYRPKDFRHLAWDLSCLVFHYNRLCVRAQSQLEVYVSAGRFPEQRLQYLKQEWYLSRESHIRVIKNCERLTKNINETVGNRVCIDSYETLKPL